MKASELRVGNLIWLVDKEKHWEILDGHEIDECDNNPLCQPIPLTEEWLLRLGFQKRKGKDEWIAPNFRVCKTTDDDFVWPDFDLYYIELPFVHSVQNLYFALTGQELTLKEAAK